MMILLPTLSNANTVEHPVIVVADLARPRGDECDRVGITIPTSGPIIVRNHYGGSTQLMGLCREIIWTMGRPVELYGNIWSSPTYLLTLPNTCVAADTLLGFHAPRHLLTMQLNIRGGEYMFNTGVRPRLASYYAEHWNNRHLTFVRGAEMTKLDVPICASAN